MLPCGPEVSWIIKPNAFACLAERLARTGTGPNRSVVSPASESKRDGPSAKAGEEMALGESAKVVWSNIFNAPFINFARCDVPGLD
jgi:hypothetical protein